jgi:hypothetical protein
MAHLSTHPMSAVSPSADLSDALLHTTRLSERDRQLLPLTQATLENGTLSADCAATDWLSPSGLPARAVGESARAYMLRIIEGTVPRRDTPGAPFGSDGFRAFAANPSAQYAPVTAREWVRTHAHALGFLPPELEIPEAVSRRDPTLTMRMACTRVTAVLRVAMHYGIKPGTNVLNDVVDAIRLRHPGSERPAILLLADDQILRRHLEGAWAAMSFKRLATALADGRVDPTDDVTPRASASILAALAAEWDTEVVARHQVCSVLLKYFLRFPDRVDREGRCLIYALHHNNCATIASNTSQDLVDYRLRQIDGWLTWYDVLVDTLRAPGPAFNELARHSVASDPNGVATLLTTVPRAFLAHLRRDDFTPLLLTADQSHRPGLIACLADVPETPSGARAALPRDGPALGVRPRR